MAIQYSPEKSLPATVIVPHTYIIRRQEAGKYDGVDTKELQSQGGLTYSDNSPEEKE